MRRPQPTGGCRAKNKQTNKPFRLNECLCCFEVVSRQKVAQSAKLFIIVHLSTCNKSPPIFQFHFHGCPCGFCAGQSGSGQVFLQHVGYSCHSDSTNAPSSHFTHRHHCIITALDRNSQLAPIGFF